MSDETTEVAAPAVPAYAAFELVHERVMFAHWNPRTETHGDEFVPAVDLKFELSAPNSILKKIRPGLVESLYEHDRQGDIEGDFMRKLKHPQIGTIPYDWEIPRLRLVIHDPVNEAENVILAGGKANKFRITALDGGTVKLVFRCQFSEYDEELAPSFIRCVKQNVHISLSSAEEEVKPDNFQQVMNLGNAPDQQSAARQAAEAAFGKIDALAADAKQEEVIAAIVGDGTDQTNVAPITGGKRGKRTANSDIVAE